MSVFAGDRIVQPDLVHGLTRHRLPGELHGGQHPIAPPPKLRREVLFSLNSAHQLDSIRADCCFLQRLVVVSGEPLGVIPAGTAGVIEPGCERAFSHSSALRGDGRV